MGYDSLGKMMMYMEAIASEPFEVDGTQYDPPRRVIISKRSWQNYTCPEGCGACCNAYTLVMLPEEKYRLELAYPEAAKTMKKRLVDVRIGQPGEREGRSVGIFTDWQEAEPPAKCRHLNLTNGRCGIHLQHPFHCAVELLRFIRRQDTTWIGTQEFTRGWNMTQISGEKGAMCEILPPDEGRINEVVSHIHYLILWADFFGIPVLDPLRDFSFSHEMLTKDIEYSKYHRSFKYLNEPSTPGLVQMRRTESFYRIEETRE